MGGAVVEVSQLVAGESGILVMPPVHEFAYGGLDQTWKVASDEPGVFSRQLHLAAEADPIPKCRHLKGNARFEVSSMHEAGCQLPGIFAMHPKGIPARIDP